MDIFGKEQRESVNKVFKAIDDVFTKDCEVVNYHYCKIFCPHFQNCETKDKLFLDTDKDKD